MNLSDRLGCALMDARLLSDTGSAPIGRETSRPAPSSSPPAPSDSLYDHYHHRISLMVDALEREVAAARVRPVYEPVKDRERRLIEDFEGMDVCEVIFIDRSFGSARTVERVRVKHGRRPVDGRHKKTT